MWKYFVRNYLFRKQLSCRFVQWNDNGDNYWQDLRWFVRHTVTQSQQAEKSRKVRPSRGAECEHCEAAAGLRVYGFRWKIFCEEYRAKTRGRTRPFPVPPVEALWWLCGLPGSSSAVRIFRMLSRVPSSWGSQPAIVSICLISVFSLRVICLLEASNKTNSNQHLSLSVFRKIIHIHNISLPYETNRPLILMNG